MGLWHYKARAYSPHLGRFLQPDPIGYQGGLNLYAYTENDPVNFSDADRLRRICHLKDMSIQTTGRDGMITSHVRSFNICQEIPDFFGREPGERGEPAERQSREEKPQNDHDYTVERNLRCSADGGFEALKDSGAAPFVDPIPDGITTRNVTTIGQPITQLIDPSTRSVTNVTGDEHILRYGSVRLSITPTGPHSSRLTIRGSWHEH